jgi:hypothetical protein
MLKEHSASVVSRNEIKAIFMDGDEACIIYDLVTNRPVDPIPFVEWIKIEQDKVISTKVKYSHYNMKQLLDQMRKEKGKK